LQKKKSVASLVGEEMTLEESGKKGEFDFLQKRGSGRKRTVW